MTFQDQFKELANLEAKIKKDYLAFIGDKSIPLNDRWNLFVTAPSSLKEHFKWGSTFQTLENITPQRFNWYDHFSIDRGQTGNLLDIVTSLEADIKRYKKQKPSGNSMGVLFSQQPKQLDNLKEEILADNIETFVFDW